MTALRQDLRYAGRMLRKSPGFTAIALITLAIGIGANTIMFSISDLLLLLSPRKVKNPEQLVFCAIQDARFSWFRYSEYLTVRDSHLAFSDLMAQDILGSSVTLAHGDSAWQVQARYVSANYFSLLAVVPAMGRAFLPEEERVGSAPAIVLSWRCWQRLGSDPKLGGQFVTVNGIQCQVAGVAPEGFTGVTLTGPDLWLPLGSYRTVDTMPRYSARHANREYPWLHLVGRLKPDLTMPVAQAQLQALFPQLKLGILEDSRGRPSLNLRPPGRFEIGGDYGGMRLRLTIFSLVLTTASGLILVIACLNLANMLIVQGAARQREIAVRLALGGGRWRIVRQLLIESLLLALLGGIFGVLLAFWGTRILNIWIAAVQAPELRSFKPGLNVRVLAATLGVCVMATLLFGLRPALRLSKRDIAGAMKASGSVLGSLGRKRNGLSVVGQVALAVVLVLSAALLTRSALQFAQADPRFPLEDKLVVQIDPLSAGYDQVQSRQAYEMLADHLASLPDVQALGTSPRLFFGGGWAHVPVFEYGPGADQSGLGRPLARRGALAFVGRDYFRAMEVPLLRGRFFDRLDSAPKAEKVAIIDDSLARQLRPDGNALDCFVQWGLFTKADSDPYRVVGIVANMPGIGDLEVRAQMYTPTGPNDLPPYLYLHVVNKSSPDLLRRRIAEEIHRVDPRIPVLSVATLALLGAASLLAGYIPARRAAKVDPMVALRCE